MTSVRIWSFALLHKRGDQIQLTPGELTELEVGDELLFCGRFSHLDLQRWTLENDQRLHYLLTGQETSSNPILRSLRSFNS